MARLPPEQAAAYRAAMGMHDAEEGGAGDQSAAREVGGGGEAKDGGAGLHIYEFTVRAAVYEDAVEEEGEGAVSS